MISVNELRNMPLARLWRLQKKQEDKQREVVPVNTGDYFPAPVLGHQLLQQAERYWDANAKMRNRRWRCRRFYRGDQWGDPVVVNGEVMTEAEYIARQGKTPLKNNLVRPPVRNIVGQFRSASYKSIVVPRNRKDQVAGEMMTVALEGVHEANDCKELLSRMLEEFLVGADAIAYLSYAYDTEQRRAFPKITPISLEQFFQAPSTDGKTEFIGDFFDTSLEDIISLYARAENGSIDAQIAVLKSIYAGKINDLQYESREQNEAHRQSSFLIPEDHNMCRVFRIHRLEGRTRIYAHDRLDGTYSIYDESDLPLIEANNRERKRMAETNGVDVPLIEYEKRYIRVWMYYHISPQGHILFASENPYQHNSHPYVVKFYPGLDGEAWSMIDDLIDQQKMINRMFILQDFILSASAKGVLLVPEDCIPDDTTLEEIAEEYTKYNGVVKIRLKPGMQYPQQIVNNNVPVGLTDMISKQIQLIDIVGGVHGALQGKTAVSGTSNALYQQETSNAQLNVLDYLESFYSFIRSVDYKAIQLIMQYYTNKQYISLVGQTSYNDEAHYFDPERIAGVKFSNTIQRMDDRGTLRQFMEEQLSNLLANQLITLDMYLENSNLPFSDKLLQQVKAAREQAAQGNVAPEQLQQITSGINGEMQQQGIQGNPAIADRLLNNRQAS